MAVRQDIAPPVCENEFFRPSQEVFMAQNDPQWQLQPGVVMNEQVAADVARIACALKSLSMYTSLVLERDDCPADLHEVVDEGVAAIGRVFVW
jgi:hypothetical protein